MVKIGTKGDSRHGKYSSVLLIYYACDGSRRLIYYACDGKYSSV